MSAPLGPDQDAAFFGSLVWIDRLDPKDSAKVAVVIDEDPCRDAWLASEGWKVTNAERLSDVDSLIDSLSDQVGGDR